VVRKRYVEAYPDSKRKSVAIARADRSRRNDIDLRTRAANGDDPTNLDNPANTR
jgi:hypothetical protein